MWAKLASQSGDHMTLSDAMEALVYAGERRNEPFMLKGKRYIEYRSKNHSLTRKEPRVFRDLNIADAALAPPATPGHDTSRGDARPGRRAWRSESSGSWATTGVRA
jgi:hypothetical protein